MASTNEAEFLIRRVPGGRFTEWLFDEARIGSTINITGSFGNFVLSEAQTPLLCIAGGSGLAPVLSMLQGARHTMDHPRKVTLVFGARSCSGSRLKTGVLAFDAAFGSN